MKKTELNNKLKAMTLPELDKELEKVVEEKELTRLNNKVGKSKNSSLLRVLADRVAVIRTLITERPQLETKKA